MSRGIKRPRTKLAPTNTVQDAVRMEMAKSFQRRQVSLNWEWKPICDIQPGTNIPVVRNWKTYYPLRQLLSEWQAECNISNSTEGTIFINSMEQTWRMGLKHQPTAASTEFLTNLQSAIGRMITYRHRGTSAVLNDEEIFDTREKIQEFIASEILPGEDSTLSVCGSIANFEKHVRTIPFDVNFRSGKKTVSPVFGAAASKIGSVFMKCEPGQALVQGGPQRTAYWCRKVITRMGGKQPEAIKFSIDADGALTLSSDIGTLFAHDCTTATNTQTADTPLLFIVSTSIDFTISV